MTDMVTMPKATAELLVEAAKNARYSGPPDPDQVECITAYEEQIKPAREAGHDSVGHPVDIEVRVNDHDVAIALTTVTNVVVIPTNYISGTEAVTIAGQLGFLLGISTIRIVREKD